MFYFFIFMEFHDGLKQSTISRCSSKKNWYEKDIYNKEREQLLINEVLEDKGLFISTLESTVDTENKARAYLLKEVLKKEQNENKVKRKI